MRLGLCLAVLGSVSASVSALATETIKIETTNEVFNFPIDSIANGPDGFLKTHLKEKRPDGSLYAPVDKESMKLVLGYIRYADPRILNESEKSRLVQKDIDFLLFGWRLPKKEKSRISQPATAVAPVLLAPRPAARTSFFICNVKCTLYSSYDGAVFKEYPLQGTGTSLSSAQTHAEQQCNLVAGMMKSDVQHLSCRKS
jgi:hypothetical protein